MGREGKFGLFPGAIPVETAALVTLLKPGGLELVPSAGVELSPVDNVELSPIVDVELSPTTELLPTKLVSVALSLELVDSETLPTLGIELSMEAEGSETLLTLGTVLSLEPVGSETLLTLGIGLVSTNVELDMALVLSRACPFTATTPNTLSIQTFIDIGIIFPCMFVGLLKENWHVL